MPRKSSRDKLSPTTRKLIHASLPQPLADRYIRTVDHWIRSKGLEWTAARLKALWNMALLARSGQKEQIPKVCRESRIACDSSYPKGIEGILVRQFAEIQAPSKLRRLAVTLRCYTSLVLPNASTAQVDKSRRSINNPGTPTGVEFVGCYPTDTIGLLPHGPKAVRWPDRVMLDKLTRLSGTSRYPSLLRIPGKDLQQQPFLSLASSLMTKGVVPDVLVDCLGDFQLRKLAAECQSESGDATFGRINVIQEGGAKGRVVCSPNAWVQYYMYPFHQRLVRYLTRVESREPGMNGTWGVSCALDQLRGVSVALSRLENGSFCAGVDLSSATDRFPLDYQVEMTKYLGVPEMGSALSALRGPYWAPDGDQWTYGAGQPMGVYGSFPLFHLSHFALLNGLSYQLDLPMDRSNFAVLGDDVLIFDENLLGSYLSTLERWQVPVSWHKSYQGNLVEFAGFLITKSGNSWTAFRPYKHQPDDFSSVIQVLHGLGVPVRGWSSYWAKAFDEYTATRGMRHLSLEPLIPEDRPPVRGDGLPGSRWIGSQLNRAAWFLPDYSPAPADYQRAWEADRYALLKEVELPMDIGHPGVTDPSVFNPADYQQDDLAHKRLSNLWVGFGKDPLVRELRQRREAE